MSDDIPKDLQEEVDYLIDRIGAFQAAQGRKIAKYFKRSRKARAHWGELEAYGLPLPLDYKAMCWNHDGVDPGAVMTWHEMAILLDYRWPDVQTAIAVNRTTRKRPEFPRRDWIWIAREETRFTDLNLAPTLAIENRVPLVVSGGPRSAEYSIAFDSSLAMLRTVVAAQDAGITSYDEEKQCRYPLDEMADIAGRFNTRQTYWTELAQGTVKFLRPTKSSG